MRITEGPRVHHRYAVLDSYRFIAALGIVIYHYNAHLSGFTAHPYDGLDRFQTLVDFFFVLSGFVLMHTYGRAIHDVASYGDFLRKRIARVYPLQLATLMLCVLLYGIVKARGLAVHDPSIIDMQLVPANLLLIQAWGVTDHMGLNSPSWSISAEAFVYILFPFFVAITLRLRPVPTLGLAVLIAMLIEGVRAAAGLRSGSLATYDCGMLRAVPMFLAGIAVYEIVTALPVRRVSWLIPHALAGLIVLSMLLNAPFAAIDLLYPPLVGLIAMAERGGRPTLLARPWFTQLGNASFAIYMIHTFVQIASVALVRHFGWTSVPALLLVATGGTVVIVLCGVASFHVFETPMRRWLGGPRRRASARSSGLGYATLEGGP